MKGKVRTEGLFGVSRIYWSLCVQGITLSECTLVRNNNPYYIDYHYTKLPMLKNIRSSGKTIVINKTKQFYLNYRLRAAVRVLGNICSSHERTYLITINFSEKFASELSKKPRPVSYYGELLKKRLARFQISDFLIVLEVSKNSSGLGLHAHIIMNLAIKSCRSAIACLAKNRELAIDKHGRIASSSVNVTDGYRLHQTNGTEQIQLDLEYDSKNSIWRKKGRSRESRLMYETRHKMPIDVGVADYLSKGLSKSIFGTSNNYYMTNSLRRETNSLLKLLIQCSLSIGQ